MLGIPVSQQHLVYNLRELADGASLREHGVAAGARLRLVLALRGGPVTTRRPPPPERPPPDREELEWSGESSGSGCKVTVLLFHEGERVNMLRVRENRDGTYSPLDHAKYSSSLSHLLEHEADEALTGSLQENAVTMGKMLDLRRRMESLSIHRRRNPLRSGDKAEIQKTRSEETLSVPSLLDEPPGEAFSGRTYAPFGEPDEGFGPLCDVHYTRYDYDYAFADRYTLLPPIGTRADSNQSLQDSIDNERFKLPETLAGSVLVKGGQRDEEKAAILEECIDGSAEECRVREDPQYHANNLAPIPAAKYGALVGGEARSWRRGFGSSSQLAGGGSGAGVGSATGCGAGILRAPRPRAPPLSASTSDLEQLTRNRILPALSRHRNREHLHLSDERLELARPPPRPERRPGCDKPSTDTKPPSPDKQPPPEQGKEPRRLRCGFCRRRLSAATEHRCRCGGAYCAPHRYAEVHGCAYDYKALRPHRN
ncbi:AN1-type zinc finger protein 4-like isoform X2 [Battus philenor]|uniref:AN1-type zinc finger protein 4-like isoform X2 n=1 Tax=Battus philenor TaxID=42288 RepID=UPI0035CF66AD